MSRWIACAVGALLFVLLGRPLWQKNFPSIPPPLALGIAFPPGVAGQCEPLITTGVANDGDLLAVRYLDEQNAILLYDVWGVGGPQSAPFALHPGERRRLEIEMPTLSPVSQVERREKRPLRIALDGQVLLQEPVFFHRRRPAEISFATNPIGGTLTTGPFRGTLALPDGHVVRGGPESMFDWPARLGWLFRARLGHLLAVLLGSAAAGLAVSWLVPHAVKLWARDPIGWHSPNVHFGGNPNPPHLWFFAAAGLCLLAFTAVVTGGTFRLFYPESFGNFYDYQAASLLQGRLDVPAAALEGEAFVFEGKYYGYFGPTPAFLRLPFAALGVGLGRLSRSYMIAYYAGCLTALYALLILASRRANQRETWPGPFTTVVFITSAGLGTTLFFLSSRAYIYHEAILCGAMFALWSAYFSLRHLDEPTRKWWMAALTAGALAVHARPPVGLFALSLIGVVAAVQLCREVRGGSWRKPLAIGSLAILGVLSFNGLSYLKFKSFDGAPLKYHVQYNPGRLAAIEGRNFHPENIPYNSSQYIWRPNFQFRPTFPYFYIEGSNPANFPRAKIDLAEPVLALPYTMPAVFSLALLGGTLAFARWPRARWPIAIVALAALPMAGALFMAVAVSQRYTADFCPALLITSAFGLVALELLAPVWLRAARFVVAILTAASISVTVAITLHYQGEVVWGTPADVQARYQSLRKTVDSVLGLVRE